MANTASPSKGNDIVDRVIDYWNERREVHPEVSQMADDKVRELVDAIPLHEAELCHAVARYRH